MVIYEIRNLINGHFYIGSSTNFNRRKTIHLCDLKKKKHHCRYLQNAWNKYGENNFIFTILKTFDIELTIDELLNEEQKYIDSLNPQYNMSRITNRGDRSIDVSKEGRKIAADKISLNWVVTSPDGREFKIRSLQKFCKDNNLQQSCMWAVANGVYGQHKGWKIKYENDEDYRYKNRGSRNWKITFPDGKVEIIQNLAKYCRENGFNMDSLIRVARKIQKDWNGYLCSYYDYPERKVFLKNRKDITRKSIIETPEGDKIIVDNLKEFCKSKNLNPEKMYYVYNGIRPHYNGYKCKPIE